LRGVEDRLAEIEQLGVKPVAISVDSPVESRDLCKKAGFNFQFLSDPNTTAIRAYDLLHVGGGVSGHDVARPGEFLVDSNGVVRWVNLTEDFRVRARAEQFIAQAKQLK
jgi:peroxiredoxin